MLIPALVYRLLSGFALHLGGLWRLLGGGRRPAARGGIQALAGGAGREAPAGAGARRRAGRAPDPREEAARAGDPLGEVLGNRYL